MSNINSFSDRAQTMDDMATPSEALAGELSALTLESPENGEAPNDESQSLKRRSLALDALETVKQIAAYILADAEDAARDPTQDAAPPKDPGPALDSTQDPALGM
ncbi:hypothetical protein HYE68_004021 [Fusarium pseudograminearum]|nr:hypothetical protein HYE68_004021 [Fusarium pseudograminearum]